MAASTAPASLAERLRAALGAWQPFTGRGVAAFARATGTRLLTFQVLFAALGALALMWSLRVAWLPVVERALRQLPDSEAGIRSRNFRWPGTNSALLAANPQLALAADPAGANDLGQNADLQVELGARELRFRGLLGQVAVAYPADIDLPLDRVGASAAWGAWRLPLLVLVTLGAFTALLLSWWALATLYAPLVALLAWVSRRPLDLAGAWRLASAALLPAGLLMAGALLLYATNWLRLPGLASLFALHFVAGVAWLAWALLVLPRRATPPAANPFDAASATMHSKPAPPAKNPFGS